MWKYVLNAIHFILGKQKLIDTAGRIEKFNRKYGKAQKKEAAQETAAPE